MSGKPEYHENGIHWLGAVVEIGCYHCFWGFCEIRKLQALKVTMQTPTGQKALTQRKGRFSKDQINTDCEMSGDPVYFACKN